MYNNYNLFLQSLASDCLGCGYGDLGILERTQYDLQEILDDVKDRKDGKPVTVNDLINEIFSRGADELQRAVEDARFGEETQLEHYLENGGSTECEEYFKLTSGDLYLIEPDEDMGWNADGTASRCWLDEKDVYLRCIPDQVHQVEEHMGFRF